MKFFKTVSLEFAIENIKMRIEKELEKEELPLHLVLNRVIAENIFATMNLPSFTRSTVDGYCVKGQDIYGGSEFSPIPLKLIGESEMGLENNLSIESGECIYVPTGGMLSNNSDTMVMIEDCETLGDEILINKGIAQFSNVIFEGSEVKKEELLIKENQKLNSSHIAVLASMGINKVKVFKKIRFSIISTGDEVVELGNELKKGEIYDINTHIFRALIEEGFGEVQSTFLVKDNCNDLSRTLNKALENSEVVMISGGSSVGVRDFTEKAIKDIGGEIFVHGIALKPGKPTIIAKYKDKFVFGMPGHPQSGVSVFKALIEPIFLKKNRVKVYGELQENIYGDPGKTTYINVRLENDTKKLFVYPIKSKSAMVKPLLEATGYIVIPEYKEGLYNGEMVEVVLND
ncbi:molybdopterin molybdotransferase MoeA [Cetobacterium sp.]|uniref:molybdopterin molybdotransferase MoeA n=1 Tax=Cetobacterium sp. TaxID=2071632 RepID=UPI003F392672